MGSSSGPGHGYDYAFKILLIGDSGVGKSSLLVSFISNHLADDLSPTIGQSFYISDSGGACVSAFMVQNFSPLVFICFLFYLLIGVDFKIKHLAVGDEKLKLTIWDTAGQERFRTLTSSYYRGSQGIILVYDVTKRETFTNLADVWVKEVELYSTNRNCVKVLVGNKVDKEADRMVTREEGIAFANEYGCLFIECSAKTRANVEKCFEELALKIMGVPKLVEEGSVPVKRNILKQKQEQHGHQGGCCS
ncbi:RAB [Musa troglodytarum]|uniref:RAB n=1 Tax=Musa troglodytarum TaxID=320322 RepID=A0A9E7EUR8_9LILI|nr:RAB [Musa troglodytarum]